MAPKFEDLINEILVTETPLKRKTTQGMHVNYLTELREELGHVYLNDFTRAEYMKWITAFKSKKKRSTFDDYTKFINIIFNYAYQNKYITNKIKFPKTDPEKGQVGRVYTDAELLRIYSCTHGTLLVQFVLSFECFMRLREVLYLTWDRVDLDKKFITLRKQDVKTGSRTGMGRFIPLSDFAYNLLVKMKYISTSIYVFPNPAGTGPQHSNKKAWSTVKRHAKISGRARWHDIRHTALTKAALEKMVSPTRLCKVAGLSIRTLERVYLHSQIEYLREVTKSLEIKKIS